MLRVSESYEYNSDSKAVRQAIVKISKNLNMVIIIKI